MRALFLSLLILKPIQAETLHLLAIEVERKLIEPTLVRSLGGDRDALEDALSKLRKLTDSGRVVESASVSLERGEGNSGKNGFEIGPDIPGRGQAYREFGWSLGWDSRTLARKLKIKPRATASSAPVIDAVFVHPLDGRWSLSAATTTARGALFVFEKVDGSAVLAEPPLWVAASLLFGGKPSSSLSTPPEKWLSSADPIRSAILRATGGGNGVNTISVDLKPFCGAWRNYSSSKIGFSSQAGRGADDGKIVSRVEFEYVTDIGSSSHKSYAGDLYHVVATEKLPNTLADPIEVVTRSIELKGSTTSSVPLPAKKSEQHQLKTLVFRSD